MARDYADSGELFRVRFTHQRADGTTYDTLTGPYPSIGTAKGQRTYELNNHDRWNGRRNPPRPGVTAVIERCVPTWEVVA